MVMRVDRCVMASAPPPRADPRRPDHATADPGSRRCAIATASSTSAGDRMPISTLATLGCPNGNCSAAARNGTSWRSQTSWIASAFASIVSRRRLVVVGGAGRRIGEDAGVVDAAGDDRDARGPRTRAAGQRARTGPAACSGRPAGSSRSRRCARTRSASPTGSCRPTPRAPAPASAARRAPVAPRPWPRRNARRDRGCAARHAASRPRRVRLSRYERRVPGGAEVEDRFHPGGFGPASSALSTAPVRHAAAGRPSSRACTRSRSAGPECGTGPPLGQAGAVERCGVEEADAVLPRGVDGRGRRLVADRLVEAAERGEPEPEPGHAYVGRAEGYLLERVHRHSAGRLAGSDRGGSVGRVDQADDLLAHAVVVVVVDQLATDREVAHHRDPVGERDDLRQVGGDQQDRLAVGRPACAISSWNAAFVRTSMPTVGSSMIRMSHVAPPATWPG